tara:strand:+ start:237 stop:407 length:171 start_codon:yes stop_codon:yes gene_type:complete
MVDYSGIPNTGDKILNPRGDFAKPDLKKIRKHRDWFYKKAKVSPRNKKAPGPNINV